MSKDKTKLRREVSGRVARLARTARRAKSRAIMAKLFGLKEFRQAKVLQLYCSFGREVDTEAMIRRALAQGKHVAVPVTRANGTLSLSEVTDPARDLVRGQLGVPEPKIGKIGKTGATRPVSIAQIELAVVPGVAFDTAGRRLGRGTGHFDRFLSALRGWAKRPPGNALAVIALAYEAQMVPRVPAIRTDMPVDVIITERRVIRCRGRRNARQAA